MNKVNMDTGKLIESIKQKIEQLDKNLTRLENFMKTSTVSATTKMATSASTTTITTPKSTSTTPMSEHLSPIINEYYENLIETLDDTKSWTIVIAIGILLIITIKTISLCKKVYKIHNEKIIMKARISPQI